MKLEKNQENKTIKHMKIVKLRKSILKNVKKKYNREKGVIDRTSHQRKHINERSQLKIQESKYVKWN